MSSREWPFHSAQRWLAKEPTWYAPAASHASAMIFVSASIGSSAINSTIGGVGTRSALGVAAKHRREVEAEAIDVVVVHPMPQAMEDHLADDRVIAVHRVAATAEI